MLKGVKAKANKAKQCQTKPLKKYSINNKIELEIKTQLKYIIINAKNGTIF